MVKTIGWINTIDWEPENCFQCNSQNSLKRVSIQTAQGFGADSWKCLSCGIIIQRIGTFKGGND